MLFEVAVPPREGTVPLLRSNLRPTADWYGGPQAPLAQFGSEGKSRGPNHRETKQAAVYTPRPKSGLVWHSGLL